MKFNNIDNRVARNGYSVVLVTLSELEKFEYIRYNFYNNRAEVCYDL